MANPQRVIGGRPAARTVVLAALPPLLVVAALLASGSHPAPAPAEGAAARAWAAAEHADRARPAAPAQRASCRAAERPVAVDAGATFAGLRADPPRRRCTSAGLGWVTVAYGGCPVSERPCAVPLEIQTWPACERGPRAYGDLPYRRALFGGRLAAVYDEGERVEVLAGDRTVVLFGADAERVRAAAGRLRAADGVPLPTRPAPGILTGRLRCR